MIAICGSTYGAPDKGKNEGKSAQTNSFRSERDDDRNELLSRNRNTFLSSSDLNRNSFHTVTPRPQIVTVTTTPQTSFLPNQGQFLPSHGVGGGLFPSHDLHTLGGGSSIFGGSGFPSLASPVNTNSIFLLAQDPNMILRNPQLLILHPQLAVVHRALILQYPQLRHYVSPFVLNILEQRFGSRSQFQRVFPQTVLGGQDHLGSQFLDLNTPIDLNRPVLTTISPFDFGGPTRSIRFQKK